MKFPKGGAASFGKSQRRRRLLWEIPKEAAPPLEHPKRGIAFLGKSTPCFFDLGSGFLGVGFPPEGSYFGPLALKICFLQSVDGSKKASRFDLESGFPGVGFAPEGSYFSRLALKACFLRSFEGSKKASRFDLELGFPGVGFAPEGSYFGPLALKVCFFAEFWMVPKTQDFQPRPGSAVQRFRNRFRTWFSGSAVHRFSF